MKVPGRVLVNRGVAAAYVTATQTEPQMYPLVVVLSALLASIFASGFVDTGLVGVFAGQKRVSIVAFGRVR